METTKTIPKNKIKIKKKGQPIKTQLKTKKKIDQKIQEKTPLFFSCYALAALQPLTTTTINQDIHHKTTT